ncbi:MAG: ABC transporter permease [Anaerolineae bacterium]
MAKFLIRRIIVSIPVFIGVTILSFALIHAVPGGPTARLELDPDIKPEDIARIKANMGLDRPVWEQYIRWFMGWPPGTGGIIRGDFGVSYINQLSVSKEMMQRLPKTILLTGTALLLTLVIALPFGVYSAVKQYSSFDNISTVLSTAGIAIPSFWLGLMMILIFSVRLRWFPTGGVTTIGEPFSIMDLLHHLAMPAFVLAAINIAAWNRYIRGSMLEVIRQDYVRTARAKGLKDQTVIFRHALRNALIPVATLLGLTLPNLVSGALITETIFSWPGIGRLAWHAATKRDYPIIMGVLVLGTAMVIVGNLLADIAYSYLDPRIKQE